MVFQGQKDFLMGVIRTEMQKCYEQMPAEERGSIGSYCLFWADLTVKILRSYGIDAQIQAGSAFWPCLPDGLTTYGFKFEWNKQTYQKIIEGGLPEIHVWAATTNPPAVIDPVTFNFKLHAIQNGYEWRAPDPPDYIWIEPGAEWPKGVSYMPDIQAIEYVYSILNGIETQSPFAIRILRKFDK